MSKMHPLTARPLPRAIPISTTTANVALQAALLPRSLPELLGGVVPSLLHLLDPLRVLGGKVGGFGAVGGGVVEFLGAVFDRREFPVADAKRRVAVVMSPDLLGWSGGSLAGEAEQQTVT